MSIGWSSTKFMSFLLIRSTQNRQEAHTHVHDKKGVSVYMNIYGHKLFIVHWFLMRIF
jgi:hypothetical protein